MNRGLAKVIYGATGCLVVPGYWFVAPERDFFVLEIAVDLTARPYFVNDHYSFSGVDEQNWLCVLQSRREVHCARD
jgi:hypothetical protein